MGLENLVKPVGLAALAVPILGNPLFAQEPPEGINTLHVTTTAIQDNTAAQGTTYVYDPNNIETPWFAETNEEGVATISFKPDGNRGNNINDDERAYPNPTSGQARARYHEAGIASIIDLNGKILARQSLDQDNARVVVDNLKPGMYFVRIFENDGDVKTQKISLTGNQLDITFVKNYASNVKAATSNLAHLVRFSDNEEFFDTKDSLIDLQTLEIINKVASMELLVNYNVGAFHANGAVRDTAGAYINNTRMRGYKDGFEVISNGNNNNLATNTVHKRARTLLLDSLTLTQPYYFPNVLTDVEMERGITFINEKMTKKERDTIIIQGKTIPLTSVRTFYMNDIGQELFVGATNSEADGSYSIRMLNIYSPAELIVDAGPNSPYYSKHRMVRTFQAGVNNFDFSLSQDPNNFYLVGKILNEENDQPIANAEIIAWQEGNRLFYGLTGQDGTYTTDGITSKEIGYVKPDSVQIIAPDFLIKTVPSFEMYTGGSELNRLLSKE